MPRSLLRPLAVLWLLTLLLSPAPRLHAQKHSLGSAPPTAPSPAPAPVVRQPAPTPVHPMAPVSSGLGAIQFFPANSLIPAPQTLTRQLTADDERTRAGALASLGAPSGYYKNGHPAAPHSIQLDMVQLGTTDELDALLTVELDQHLISAVMVPEGDGWRRVATLLFATAFNSGVATPASFVRPSRSWSEPGRYRAVYHAIVSGQNQDFTENEADVRILNGRAVVIISFVSGARQCESSPASAAANPPASLRDPSRPARLGCEILQRWLEPDPADPTHHFVLITGTGHFSAHEADDPLSRSRNYRLTRLRAFSCQPFAFSDTSLHFEPTSSSSPCAARDAAASSAPPHSLASPDHPSSPDHP